LPATDGVADAVAAANARAGGRRAPRIAALPERVTEDDVSRLAMLAAAAGVPAPEPGGGFLLGIGEFRSRPVEIDLLADGAHLAVYGDVRSGRSTVLARAVRYLLRRLPSEALAVHVVDPTRRLIALADEPHVRTYATSPAAAEKLAIELGRQLAARQPPEDATIDDLRAGRLWDGPLHAVVVDDYDLLLSSMGSPLDPLAEVAAQARDVGLHLLVARQVAGSQRSAFDPFTQRLRELRPTSLVLAGPPDEGPVVAGVIPRPMPPGRGQLVDPAGRHLLVQCCVEETSA
jgi:S-DNA-T family DNA segregation ATPase FtsK/SpoIIIE